VTSQPEHDRDEARRGDSREALERLAREDGAFFGSALRRAAAHFSASDALRTGDDGRTDRIELWGRRVGRALSLVGVLGLAIYLWLGYLR
jgi:hypothetical protein